MGGLFCFYQTRDMGWTYSRIKCAHTVGGGGTTTTITTYFFTRPFSCGDVLTNSYLLTSTTASTKPSESLISFSRGCPRSLSSNNEFTASSTQYAGFLPK